MKFPPKPRTKYILNDVRNRRIFRKLRRLSKKDFAKNQEKLFKLLCSQLEDDWWTPLEKFVDKLLK